MANREHLAVARQGAEAISRLNGLLDPEDRLDLYAADLRGLDLVGADLRRADLRRARMQRANLALASLSGALLGEARLSEASLERADLGYADLTAAVLQNANLAGAHLSRARLGSANLRKAALFGADLTEADLVDADLRSAMVIQTTLHACRLDRAILNRAVFQAVVVACDLSECIGLGSVVHEGPSRIDVATLELTLRGSGGVFSRDVRRFLEGTGLPELFLDYVPDTFSANPLQFYSCFISYTEADEPFPTRLYNDLTDAHIRCWRFNESAMVGRSIWANIDQAIRVYDKMILVCSESSLRRLPVLREIERALQKEEALMRRKQENPDIDADVLVPVRLDDYLLHNWQHERRADVVNKVAADFRGWQSDEGKYERELGRLIAALDPRSWLIGGTPAVGRTLGQLAE